MSYNVKPIKFEEAFKRLKARKEIGSRMTSKQWASLPAAIRDRSFFASRVASARFLSSAKKMLEDFMLGTKEEVISPDGVKSIAFKTGGRADFVKKMQDFSIAEGMGDPLPEGVGRGDRGVIPETRDISSNRRLKLVYDTNIRSSYGYGNFEASVDPAITNVYPAWRFIRTGVVKEPRPLHKRFEGAVRRKDDTKFWLEMNKKEIGGLGVPHGPWGFNSQMDVQEVGRREAESLGLIKKNQKIRSPKSAFNKKLSVSEKRMDSGIFKKLKKAMSAKMKLSAGKLLWARK